MRLGAPRRSHRAAARSRLAAWGLSVLRAFVIVTALHGAGLLHGLVDLVHADEASHDQDGTSDHDCPFERSGMPCPPGCADCHCLGGASDLPKIPAPLPAAPAAVTELPEPPYDAAAPPSPPALGVFRPPRSARA